MKVISKEARTIKILGVNFTPEKKGVEVPANLVSKMKENHFFKHFVEVGSFEIVNESKRSTSKPKTEDK